MFCPLILVDRGSGGKFIDPRQYPQLLQGLDQLQEQLDTETEALRRHSQTLLVTQQEYWCFYCEQIRAHYQMLLRQVHHTH